MFEYELTLDLGLFFDLHYNRKILEEKLLINEKPIFLRRDSIDFYDMNVIDDYMINGFVDNKESILSLSKNNVNGSELFLMNRFKLMFSSKIVDIITEWFENKFIVIYRADTVEINRIKESKAGTNYVEHTINEAAKLFGINYALYLKKKI